MTLTELAERLGCRLEGDGEIEVDRVAGIEQAGPGDLTFFANPKYARAAARDAGVGGDPRRAPPTRRRARCCAAPNPYLAFAQRGGTLRAAARAPAGVHRLADVAPSAVDRAPTRRSRPSSASATARAIGARTIVYPHVTIGAGAIVGDDCVIHARVSIRERVAIGNRVVVQDGAVIGSDGFGFAQRADGTHHKIPQIGGVVIEDDVEIGANTTIDRPAVGETRIGAGTKIDNLVQIAHGVKIGRDVLLAAQVGIAGSTVVEDA